MSLYLSKSQCSLSGHAVLWCLRLWGCTSTARDTTQLISTLACTKQLSHQPVIPEHGLLTVFTFPSVQYHAVPGARLLLCLLSFKPTCAGAKATHHAAQTTRAAPYLLLIGGAHSLKKKKLQQLSPAPSQQLLVHPHLTTWGRTAEVQGKKRQFSFLFRKKQLDLMGKEVGTHMEG